MDKKEFKYLYLLKIKLIFSKKKFSKKKLEKEVSIPIFFFIGKCFNLFLCLLKDLYVKRLKKKKLIFFVLFTHLVKRLNK